jgi:CRISPR-associated protein Cmr2
MAARKATLTWDQPPWAAAGVPKCSLCGARESVLDEALFDTPVATGRTAAKGALAPEVRRRLYGVHGAERLCGVGLLKRHGVRADEQGGGTAERFASTSHLAARCYMRGVERLAESDAGEAKHLTSVWQRYLQEVKAVHPALLGEFRHSLAKSPLFGDVDGGILLGSRLMEAADDLTGADRQARKLADNALAKFRGPGP